MVSVFDQGRPPPCPAPFNLAAYVLAKAHALGEKDALLILGPDGEERLSFAGLAQAVGGTAAGLRAAGILAGDKLLLRLGNTVDFPILFLGAIAAGVVPVPTSAQLTASEVARQIEILSPAAILRAPGIAAPDTGRIIGLDEAQRWRALPPLAPQTGDPDRLAYIVFTSGTSGTPRAVAHAHRAIWARRMMIRDWAALHENDRLMHAGAFNWTYTLGTGLLDPWTCGATALIPQAGLPPAELPALMARHDATIFAAAPGVYRQMLRGQDRLDLPSLRHGLSAGEKMPAALMERWQHATGTQVHEAFGMSECSTFISGAPDRPATPGAVGAPQRGRHVALLGPEGPVPRGTPGIIAVHKDDPGLMLGYLGAPEVTAARFRDNWFLTGDLAVADDAFQLTYLGRDDDMINAGGLRVSPLEIERVLTEMPGVTAAAAIEARPRPDTTIITAFYTGPAPLDAADFNAYVKDKLARYKQPRQYIHLADLPTGANGKLQRRVLRARLETQDD